MREDISYFEKEIYSYCDRNIEKKALFPAFVNLWDKNYYIHKKDLVVITSRIISELLKKKILIEVPKEDLFVNGYGLYKILPHEALVMHDDIFEKRIKLLG